MADKNINLDGLADAIALIPQEQIETALQSVRATMNSKQAKIFDEKVKIALARIDRKAGLEFFMRNGNGAPIRLTSIQKFALDFIDEAWKLGQIPIVNLPMATGKFQAVDCKLLTPNGWIRMGDIKVGDEVIGSDGKGHKVLAIYPQGLKDSYKVTFSDGSFTECGDEHLWEVTSGKYRYLLNHPEKRYIKRKDGWNRPLVNRVQDTLKRVVQLKDIKNDLKDRFGNKKWFIPIVEAVEFNSKQALPIDAYLLGLLLGDGYIADKNTTLGCADIELIDYMQSQVVGTQYVQTKNRRLPLYCYRTSNKLFMQGLRDLGLTNHKAWEKFIPECYKLASISDRISLLAGILDTDGSCLTNKRGASSAEYTTTSKKLADDVQFIVWSLGGLCRINSRVTEYTYKGIKKKGRISYRLIVKLPSRFNPFRLKRKADIYIPNSKYPPTRVFDKIEYVGKKESQCITVDTPDGLYLTDSLICTHNTFLSTGLLAWEIGKNQNIKSQFICASDAGAEERTTMVGKILKSGEYRKLFPHIIPDKPWSSHRLQIKRTAQYIDEDGNEISDNTTEGMAINATVTGYGVTSAGLGSRSERTIFDDIPTYENAIKSPAEGIHVERAISLKWLSRRETPVGMANKAYSISADPWRGLFINTPWHNLDAIFQRRTKENYSTIVVGVNQSFTGYNVEIWNFPENIVKRLKLKYQLCECGEDALRHQNYTGICVGDDDPVHGGPCITNCQSIKPVNGTNIYLDYPAQHTFTLHLSRPDVYYRQLQRENERDFNHKYRCIVYSDQERAFPAFANSLNEETQADGINPKYPVIYEDIYNPDDSKLSGARGYIPKEYRPIGMKFAAVDLSGIGRRGTVITVGVMLSNFTRVPIEIINGAWSGNQIAYQISEMHKRHSDITSIWVENASQQQMFIDLMKNIDKEEKPWWFKVSEFKTTGKTKNHKMIGVLAMAQAFANKAFIIPNSTIQRNHPQIGDAGYEKGCPCGFCKLIYDCRIQMRSTKIESDFIMSFWMWHSSMPQFIDMPTPIEPTGIDYSNNGLSLMEEGTTNPWTMFDREDDYNDSLKDIVNPSQQIETKDTLSKTEATEVDHPRIIRKGSKWGKLI